MSLPYPFPPPWADAWGDDRYGLWAQLRVNVVVQRMRWIEPGSFTMGSPDGKLASKAEPGRIDNEGPQHRVTLTEGFWLADTACTQALWLAVMGGKNPSYIQADPLKPVEQVSWDDVDEFCAVLQDAAVLPAGAEVVLPTEAQWEYACRAGTTSAYNFGNEVTPAHLNIDNNISMITITSQTTVPVHALPANEWGLYQMHGNVAEWCADAMRIYTADAQDNPSGAQGGKINYFIVRGGSWFDRANGARSASRFPLLREVRGFEIGFRFALRSTGRAAGGRRP
jgi:formylglycine-generating enzyme required for sulfatase activity